jgi:hypothetical protein
MPYAIKHEDKGYLPDGSKLPEGMTTEDWNAQIEAQELTHWQAQPERAFVYVLHGEAQVIDRAVRVTTWTGELLGTGILGPKYKCPTFGCFPSTRRSIRVKGTNGAEYFGTYYESSGDYARMRKYKAK